jgi:glycosyltransferase involved in cell wall biosynthesis
VATILPFDISVVVPAHNEEGRIAQVLRELQGLAREVVVVDDASTDATAAVAGTHAALVVRHQRQTGYLGAVASGIRVASCPVVVLIDADGEYDPRDIPLLAAPILNGEADLVLGARHRKPRWSEAVLNWLANLRVPGDSGTGIRALSRKLALALPMTGKCVCGTSLLEPYLLGARIEQRPVRLRPVNKRRRVQWKHSLQLFYVLRLLIARRQSHAFRAGNRSS